MIKNIKLLYFVCIVLGIGLVYAVIGYYNNDDEKFNRYLNQITSIDRAEVKFIYVRLSKNDIFTSYINEEKAYLMVDLLHEIKNLEQESVTDNEIDYSYSIRNNIETSKSLYVIEMEVDETNYNIRIKEIDILNTNKKITATRYFKANSKSTALLKELLSASNN